MVPLSIPHGGIQLVLYFCGIWFIGMSREDPQLKIRLPLELKDKITESASEFGRSINADVVARLEGSFKENSYSEEEFDNSINKFLSGFFIAGANMQRMIEKGLKEKYSQSPNEELRLEISVLNEVANYFEEASTKDWLKGKKAALKRNKE